MTSGNAIVFKSLTPSRIEENAWDLEVARCKLLCISEPKSRGRRFRLLPCRRRGGRAGCADHRGGAGGGTERGSRPGRSFQRFPAFHAHASHWEQRRSGTDAPWGPGLRPEKRTVQEASASCRFILVYVLAASRFCMGPLMLELRLNSPRMCMPERLSFIVIVHVHDCGHGLVTSDARPEAWSGQEARSIGKSER